MKHKLALILIFLTLTILFVTRVNAQVNTSRNNLWTIQSIDTMKSSRDLASEKLSDKNYHQKIEEYVKIIADTGATHVALGTPYEQKFIPYMKVWVDAARKNNLKIWWRGNLAGWEGWFGYEKINRTQHIEGIESFLTKNINLFEDGDIFSSCPECENGGEGPSAVFTDVENYRKFLIEEYHKVKSIFSKNNKKVSANYYSMNLDVAKTIMDKETTKSLDGLVVVDHYVKDPDQLANDLVSIATKSAGKVFLGEFGAPIPDIHGEMSPDEQAIWLEEVMYRLAYVEQLVGVNYWTFTHGTTALYEENKDKKLPALDVLKSFFAVKNKKIKIVNEIGFGINNAKVILLGKEYFTESFGEVNLPLLPHRIVEMKVEASNYYQMTSKLDESKSKITLKTKKTNWWHRTISTILRMLGMHQ